MRIAVLALQGAFIEHEQMLSRLGVEVFEVRQLADWLQPKDGLIIPGGESTTMTKLLYELGLFDPVKQAIEAGLPVFGTCAGLILLSTLGTMAVEVVRNAYGRQLGSFSVEAPFDFGSQSPASCPLPLAPCSLLMTFIRAPYIRRVLSEDVRVLAEVDGRIVAARQGNQLATAFHPELNDDTRVHEYFLDMCRNKMSSTTKG
ncbi:MAG: pyridoxal 5'-phosphate synthase glutaminase subunit PdxT [Prevotella sp.]|nr:pyridoxal 5'-phosphate synthase glutaminase subunit PdxT [Prevotella sp.]